jgi:hypothetical protein
MIQNEEKCDNTLDDELNGLIDEIDEIIVSDFEDVCLEDNENDDSDKSIEENLDDVDIMFKFNTNNHKIEGKHSLVRDTIFKGKLEDNTEQSEYFSGNNPDNSISIDGLPIEVGSNYEFESKYHEDYIGRLNLSRDVYDLLDSKTELDFTSNRRKPNRQAFNDYYKMLLDNIGRDYTKSEIFVELSYYFTDNIFNMFKLLDKEYATQIIIELKKSGYLTNLNNINFI